MKTYLDMDEILLHCRRYIGQEYDEPYLVSAVPEEVIRSLPPADVVEVRHGKWIWLEVDDDDFETDIVTCSYCGKSYETRFSKKSFFETFKFCHNCGAKMDGWQDNV